MSKPKAFFVVSAYNNDVSWVKDYTDDYIIFDKSNTLEPDGHTIKVDNVGYNIYDICYFISNNYPNYLPKLTAFLEGNPFDHCKRETFDKLIYNECFTPIEDYSHVPETHAHIKDKDGGYMEINNSWYMPAHIQTHGAEVNKHFTNYDDFCNEMFSNYVRPDYVRFAPGAQYIVPKENILYYSKAFWEKLMGYVDYHRIPSEGHMIERALYYIFTNKWEEKP